MAKTSQDYYSILGVSKAADQKELKKSYRRLARKYHPDLHPGEKKAAMEKKFQELNEAYEVLGISFPSRLSFHQDVNRDGTCAPAAGRIF